MRTLSVSLFCFGQWLLQIALMLVVANKSPGQLSPQYVAVGESGAIVTSPDGQVWTSRTSGTSWRLRGVTASSTLWVAVGEAGKILTSVDGATWVARPASTIETLRGVAASTTRYIAVGGQLGPVVRQSTDGTTWSAVTVPPAGNLRGVTWGNNLFVTVGNAGTILTSGDGVSWTKRTAGTTERLDGVVWTGSQYQILTQSGKILSSADGVNWGTASASPPSWIEAMTWSDSRYVVVGAGGRVAVSPSGAYWTSVSSGKSGYLHGLAWSGTKMTPSSNPIALADNLRQAPEITVQPQPLNLTAGQSGTLSVAAAGTAPFSYQWRKNGTAITGATGASLPLNPVAASDGGDYTVLVSSSFGSVSSASVRVTVQLAPQITVQPQSQVFTSGENNTLFVEASGVLPVSYQWRKDGVPIAGATGSSLLGVASPGRYSVVITNSAGSTTSAEAFIAVAARDTTLGSWRVTPVSGSFNDLEFNGATGIAVGDSGAILRSTDAGSSWVSVSSGVSDNLVKVIHAGSGVFYATGWIWGARGVVLKSTDNGISWNTILVKNGQFNELFGIWTDGPSTLVVGGCNQIIRSTDGGTSFVTTSFPNGYRYAFANFDGRLIALTHAGSISFQISDDRGATWTTAPVQPGVDGLRDFAVVGDRVLAVGYRGEAAFSSDGVNFRRLTSSNSYDYWASTEFAGRYYAIQGKSLELLDASTASAARELDLNMKPLGFGRSNERLFISGQGYIASARAIVPIEVPPTISVQPQSRTVSAGSSVSFSVVANGTAPFSYQWRKGEVPISGATLDTLTLTAVSTDDIGSYSVVVSNQGGSLASQAFTLGVISAGTNATHTVGGAGYLPGAQIVISNSFVFPATATTLGWRVLLPEGWSFVSDSSNQGNVRPVAGSQQLLEWEWPSLPASPLTFSYVLAVPEGQSGDKEVVSVATFSQAGVDIDLLAKPDPLIVKKADVHSADTDRNLRINLIELTRVIELFNTRNGTERTGSYQVSGGTEDGFAVDPSRTSTAAAALARLHAADVDRDGRINLSELTRVIQLYNYRVGTVRTGQYRLQAGTEDGFAPGP